MLEVRFRRARGRARWNYTQHAHVGRAKELPAETDPDGERVAAAAGFRHAKQPGVVFKRTTGRPPTAYRAEAEAAIGLR